MIKLNFRFKIYALGAYRLEFDNSWVPLEETVKIDERKALIQQVMNKTLAITDALY